MSSRPSPRTGLSWRVSGLPYRPFRDVYPRLMGASLVLTVGWAFGAYLGTSLLFALLYALDPGGVKGAETIYDLLWFSVQTLSTIGYGGMTPETPFANFCVILESFIGLAGVAVVTAILYAKFSLPDARVRFSSVLAIHDYQGEPTLHLRMANERTSAVLDAEIQVGVVVDESSEKRNFRRMYDLELARSRIPIFGMTFTAMHIIDAESPLRRIADRDRLQFLIVTFKGIDARTLQPVFTRGMFTQDAVREGMGFSDMISEDEDGHFHLDLSRLDALEARPLSPPPPTK